MINLFIFILTFYLLLFSILGYGIFFNNLCFNKIKNNFSNNSIYIGFYGLFIVTFISLFSSFFVAHNYFHNFVVHLIGIFLLIFSRFENKKIYLRYILFISLLIFSAVLISKTHDDFSYYHLPFTKYLTEQKIIFGMGHLNHGYNLLSSLFFLNSTFYLPQIEFFGFHFGILFFLIFFNYFIISEIFENRNSEIIKYLYLFSFVFFNLSFNRISEYGTDKAGQLLIVILIIKFFQIISFDNDKKQISKILFLLPLLAYCISLKTYFIPYIVLGILIIKLKPEIILSLKKIFFSKAFLFFLFLLFGNFLHHFISTGCFISPLVKTCFGENFIWARKEDDIINLSIWLEQWAKAGAGPNFRVENVNEYIANLNWLSNWIEKYFVGKFLDQLGILFLSFIIIFLIFKEFRVKKINFKYMKKFLFFYVILIFIFLIWFLNHPTLRYGGYSAVFSVISFPIALIFFRFKNRIFFKKKMKFLILFVIIVFNIKNITRIEKEFNREDHYKFKNFPFYSLKEKNFKKYEFETGLNVYSTHHCWATPTPCGNIDQKKLYVNKKNNYYFIIQTK